MKDKSGDRTVRKKLAGVLELPETATIDWKVREPGTYELFSAGTALAVDLSKWTLQPPSGRQVTMRIADDGKSILADVTPNGLLLLFR